MIKVGQKYHDTKTDRDIEITDIEGWYVYAWAKGSANRTYIRSRFEDAIGERFILAQRKNQSGYKSLDKPAEDPAVLSVHKVDEGIWIKLVDGGAITVGTCKEAIHTLGHL